MKTKILTIIVLLLLSGCKVYNPFESNSSSPQLANNEPEVVEIPAPPDEPDATDDRIIIKFAVSSGSNMYFSDGVSMYPWKSGNIKKSGSRLFSVEDKLLTLDSSGTTIDSVDLLKVPVRIKSTSYGNFYCYQYSAVESYAMGGAYKIYSEFYLDGAVLSDWYFNQFECRDITSVGNNIFVKDQNGAIREISGNVSNVTFVKDDEFYIHSLDMINKTIGFNNSTENYSLNHILNAKSWNKFEGRYYSGNGYVWESYYGLLEAATELDKFTTTPYPITPDPPWGESPVLIAVGESDGKMYWIEANSGWLFEYRTDTDYLEQKYRLYNGNGMRNTGIWKKVTLSPIIVDGVLYFSDENVIYKLGLSTGFLNIFYAGPGEVIRYE